jgi:DNA topoisomerase-1
MAISRQPDATRAAGNNHRYHERWRARRDMEKFDRLIAFGRALPRIRRGATRTCVWPVCRGQGLAAVVCSGSTLIRVGNDEYRAIEPVIRADHAQGPPCTGGGAADPLPVPRQGRRPQEVEITDRRLARVVRRFVALPGTSSSSTGTAWVTSATSLHRTSTATCAS